MQGFRIGAIDDPKKNAHDREQDSLKTYKSLAYKNYKDDPVFIKKVSYSKRLLSSAADHGVYICVGSYRLRWWIQNS